MISFHEVLLVANFVQAVLYGPYVVTFILCIRWLVFVDEGWQVQSLQKIHWLTLTLVIILFIFSTVNLGTTSRIVLAKNSSQGVIIHKLGILKSVTESASLIITDGVLIYRCWVINGRSWRIVFLPLLLWTSTIACAMVLTCFVGTHASNSFPNRLSPLPIAIQASLLACNFATNLYATCAILYRVLPVAMENTNSARDLYSICQIVAGTGILYAATSFPLVVSIFLQLGYSILQWLCPVLEAVNFSMAGITFNLLLIRAGQLRSGEQLDSDSR